MKATRKKQVRDETFKLLTENGLTGWKVRFNPRLTRALGRCIPSLKTIEYQPKFMELNDWDESLAWEIVCGLRKHLLKVIAEQEGTYTWGIK